MILDVTENNLIDIKNPTLRAYAGKYVTIYKDFMTQVGQMGLEVDTQDTTALVADRMNQFRNSGPVVRNADKSVYLNRISTSCQACQTGLNSSTFFISLQCHRDCFYCFNPNQEKYDFYRTHPRDAIAELDQLRKTNPDTRHVALTGGEPLLFKAETYRFFEHARELFPAAHTRLYTSGDHIDRETLESLQKAGLKEIRFNIRMHDLASGHRHTYDRIALAREYIPNVMVEMPVLPDTLPEMQTVLRELDSLGIFGINLLELCFPMNNSEAFRSRGYKIKARPFYILYDYWYAGGLPVAGSEAVCLDLVAYAQEAGLKLGVHYCSLENKHTGQVYRQNSSHHLPRHIYFSQHDYFLKTAKVFGEDVPVVKKAFDKAGYADYDYSPDLDSLEFHVNQISSLKKLDIEIGLSISVIEIRENEPVIRELKVDVTTPQTFRLSKDV